MTEHFHSFTSLTDQTEIALGLLEAGVPLSLLIDLATELHSSEVYVREPEEADWLQASVA
jgi:hypothetical protein